jgi:putative transposase
MRTSPCGCGSSKAAFSKVLPREEWRSVVRQRRGERGVWQRRFREQLIRDEPDCQAHLDYRHFNPVKHGPVARVPEWPCSTSHGLVAEGACPIDWGGRGEARELGYDD